jgi:hypothetical protein
MVHIGVRIRRQSLILLIASFLPWISLLLDLLNLSPFDIDFGPFALTSSVVLFFIAFLRYQFLNIKPLASLKGKGLRVLHFFKYNGENSKGVILSYG